MNNCPNCGWSPEDDTEPTTADEYNNLPFDKFMDKALKRSSKRMKEEMGYGIPDKETEIIKHDLENLGSVITGEWRQDDNQKDN